MILPALFLLLQTVFAFQVSSSADGLSMIAASIDRDSPVRIVGTIDLELVQIDSPEDPIKEKPFTFTLDVLGDDRCLMHVAEYDLYINKQEVTAIRQGVDDSYVREPVTSTPSKAVHDLFGATWHPMLTLLYPDCSSDDHDNPISESLCSGEPIVSTGPIDQTGGLTDLVWESPMRTFMLQLDSDTNRPMGATFVQSDGDGVPPGTRLRIVWKWTYESIPEKVEKTFQSGDRFRVDRLSSLRKIDEASLPMPGGAAPGLNLPTLSGGSVDISDLRGRVLVIDFWASWCGPCKRALPELQSLADELSTSPVTILTVNCFEQKKGEEGRKTIQSAVASLSLKLPVLLDADGSVARDWGVEGLPSTFVVDKSGQIVSAHVGAGPDYLKAIRQDVVDSLGD